MTEPTPHAQKKKHSRQMATSCESCGNFVYDEEYELSISFPSSSFMEITLTSMSLPSGFITSIFSETLNLFFCSRTNSPLSETSLTIPKYT